MQPVVRANVSKYMKDKGINKGLARAWFTIDEVGWGAGGAIVDFIECKDRRCFSVIIVTMELLAAAKIELHRLGPELEATFRRLILSKKAVPLYKGCGHDQQPIQAHIELLICLLAVKDEHPSAKVGLALMGFKDKAWAPDTKLAASFLKVWLRW